MIPCRGLLLLVTASLAVGLVSSRAHAADPVRLLVMDPLAAPLSCNCVEGHGQRDYDPLAAHLARAIGREVRVFFSESLALAHRKENARFDLVIGKKSVVEYDAKATKTALREALRLTNRDGSTDVVGLFMVRSDDDAQVITDLVGRTIALGPVEQREANSAAIETLKEWGLAESCKTIALASIDAAVFALDDGEVAAAIVPDYLPRLLVGCGKVAPGRMREIGRTKPVPCISVFFSEELPTDLIAPLQQAFLQVVTDRPLLDALESKSGFSKLPEQTKETGWLDWRGTDRQGQFAGLPHRLPGDPRVYWRAKVTGPALAGIAATERFVVVPDKDRELTKDIFRCFDAVTGRPIWKMEYAARKEMDYTSAPRAAPVIHAGRVFLQGALGNLHCVDLASGEIVWKRHLVADFGAELLVWGYSVPPLVVDDKLIVAPGAKECSVCALDLLTGDVLWETPGHAAAYSAFIAGEWGGVRQIVGYDVAGLCGWDVKTGKELWRVVPPGMVDFHVATPVIVPGGLLLATENHATRRYDFDEQGKLAQKPRVVNEDLAPDTCTPAITNDRLFGTAYGELFCLDLKNSLKTVWQVADDRFFDHTNLIAGNGRILAWTTSSDLLLLRADVDRYEVVSQIRPFDRKKSESMSHPALVGDRIYLRDQEEVLCMQLVPDEEPAK